MERRLSIKIVATFGSLISVHQNMKSRGH